VKRANDEHVGPQLSPRTLAAADSKLGSVEAEVQGKVRPLAVVLRSKRPSNMVHWASTLG
jgi:hypothetical protein